MNICPECKVEFIEDINNGEYVCPRCGYVANEYMTSLEPESISTDLEERLKNVRYGAPMSYTKHDLGLSTTIANTSRDFNGNKINTAVVEQMLNVRRWQSRIRVSSSKERRLLNVLTKINEFCSNLSLPKVVSETAALIYRNYENKKATKGKGVNSMALAAICLACKKSGIIKSLKEISNACNINDTKTIHLACRYYRELLMNNNVYEHHNTIDGYIAKVVNNIKLDTKVEKLAIELANKTNTPSLTSGKVPNGLAAAYIYMASTLLGINMYQRDITAFSDVTEVTIRNRYKEIIGSHKIRLMLKCK